MNKIAEEIKDVLTLKLAECGMSVVELDRQLASLNTGEGVLKVAGTLDSVTGGGLPVAAAAGYAMSGRNDNSKKNIIDRYLSYGMPIAIGAGIAGGSLLSNADNDLEDLNTSLESERKKIEYLKNLRNRLAVEHNLNQNHDIK